MFNILLRFSNEGYLVRLIEIMPRRDGDQAAPYEYVTLTTPPEIGAPNGEAFYRQRVRPRNEMIGWIKAQLAGGAVALTRRLPVPAGGAATHSTGEHRMQASTRLEALPPELVATADDLSDLDADISWRFPTDADGSWADRPSTENYEPNAK